MAKREREVVHPLQIVDKDKHRPDGPKRVVSRLEDAHGLKQLAEPATRTGRPRESPQQVRGGGERDVLFGLIADDPEALRQCAATRCLREEPTLPAARFPDHDRRRDTPSGGSAADMVQHRELVCASDKRAHVTERTTLTRVCGSECRWARVLVYEPPERVVISWDIDPQWQLETDVDKTSEVEVRFIAEGPDRTRVELEHRNLDRHGDGWEGLRAGVDSGDGWPLYLRRFADVVGA